MVIAASIPVEAPSAEVLMSIVSNSVEPQVQFSEFVAFMAEERADAETKDELLEQFRTLSGGQPYIVQAQLSELEPELQQYCIANMPAYPGGPEGALDYVAFAAACYGEALDL